VLFYLNGYIIFWGGGMVIRSSMKPDITKARGISTIEIGKIRLVLGPRRFCISENITEVSDRPVFRISKGNMQYSVLSDIYRRWQDMAGGSASIFELVQPGFTERGRRNIQ
jgi:hypothetical protein